MADRHDVDDQLCIVYRINHPPISDANSPVGLAASELYAASRARISRQLFDDLKNAIRNWRVKPPQFAGGRA